MTSNFDIDDVRADLADQIAFDVQEALRKERIEIARMLEADASKHDDAAAELRDHYDHAEIADEAWQHENDAATLRSLARRVLVRTPAVPAPAEMDDEIAF